MSTAEFDYASLFQFLMDGHIENLRVLMKIRISEVFINR